LPYLCDKSPVNKQQKINRKTLRVQEQQLIDSQNLTANMTQGDITLKFTDRILVAICCKSTIALFIFAILTV